MTREGNTFQTVYPWSNLFACPSDSGYTIEKECWKNVGRGSGDPGHRHHVDGNSNTVVDSAGLMELS